MFSLNSLTVTNSSALNHLSRVSTMYVKILTFKKLNFIVFLAVYNGHILTWDTQV
jgi:hypothetical protein